MDARCGEKRSCGLANLLSAGDDANEFDAVAFSK
jgi:hypothetical protein